MAAAEQEAEALRGIPKEFESYKDVTMVAVEQKGFALEYVPEGLDGYKYVAEELKS